MTEQALPTVVLEEIQEQVDNKYTEMEQENFFSVSKKIKIQLIRIEGRTCTGTQRKQKKEITKIKKRQKG